MPARTSLLSGDTDGILAALDASGVVGVWSHDVWAGRIVVSDSLAADLHQPRLVAVLDCLMREIAFTLAGHLGGARRSREH